MAGLDNKRQGQCREQAQSLAGVAGLDNKRQGQCRASCRAKVLLFKSRFFLFFPFSPMKLFHPLSPVLVAVAVILIVGVRGRVRLIQTQVLLTYTVSTNAFNTVRVELQMRAFALPCMSL